MTTTEVTAWGYSDDILRIKIEVDGKVVHDDEHSPGVYDVNGLFSIYGSMDNTPGWCLGITGVEEDMAWSTKYKFFLDGQSENPYSPLLRFQTEETVTIEGIFGGIKVAFRDIAERYVDSWDINELYEMLKNKGLLREDD